MWRSSRFQLTIGAHCSRGLSRGSQGPPQRSGSKRGLPRCAPQPRLCAPPPQDSPAATSPRTRLPTVFQGGMHALGQGPYRTGTGVHMLSRSVLGLGLQSRAPLSHLSGLGREYEGFSFSDNDNKSLPRWMPISAFRSISTSPQKASWLQMTAFFRFSPSS